MVVQQHLSRCFNLSFCQLSKRFCSSETVRVRFAPSPTGLLHLGGLRTALYNHLFAKSQNGVTILRIEDTDQVRKVESAVENLIEDLEWCGIKFDEGPYFQSERLDLYKKYVEQLLAEGSAYYCFCSKLRLDLIRKNAMKAGENPKYDNCCRNLTKTEVNKYLENGGTPCIRFKLNYYNEPIPDMLRDSIFFDVASFEGDPVIFKADGFPTYHFANVVDDHLMRITHVIRGAEWQISTVKHLLLYKAFKWKPPVYGHISLMMNPDGTKLSKRQGDVHIRGLREKGYLPNAVINFIVRSGGGFDIQKSEKDSKSFTMDELIDKFDIKKVNLSDSKVSLKYLDDDNRLEIKRLLETEEGTSFLIQKVQDLLKNYSKTRPFEKIVCEPDLIKEILMKIKNRINKLEDLLSVNLKCLWTWQNLVTIEDDDNVEIINDLIQKLDDAEWNLESIKKFLKDFTKTQDFEYSKFMKLLRLILLENQTGPSIAEIFDLLGKDTVKFRLSKCIEKTKSSSKVLEESKLK